MNKRMIVTLATLALTAVAAQADSLWFRPTDGSYLWADTNNWYKDAGTHVYRVPATNDWTSNNSASTPPANPMIIDGTAICGSFVGGLADGQTKVISTTRIVSGGNLSCLSNNPTYWASLQMGGEGQARLLIDEGGSLFATNVIKILSSNAGIGLVSNAGTVTIAQDGINLWNQGKFINAGAVMMQGGRLSLSGQSSFENSGALVLSNGDITVDSTPDSEAGLTLAGGTCEMSGNLNVGTRSPGNMEIDAPVNIHNGWVDINKDEYYCEGLRIGLSTGGVGVVTLNGDNAIASIVYGRCLIGGRNWSAETNLASDGMLWLRGGELRIPCANTSNTNLFVRFNEASSGTLRGWGNVQTNVNSLRMVMNGRVIADGEGVDGRLLDLGYVTYTDQSIANGVGGTNGWYAVNKGQLGYPRLWYNGNFTRTFGSTLSTGEPDLVNSVALALTVSGTVTTKAILYASDSSAIPSGLPAGKTVIGVWSMWGQNGWDQPARSSSFSSFALTFRYDHTKVKAGQYVWLYRYVNGEWVKLARTAVDFGNPRISSGTLTRLVGATYNIGWFALATGPDEGTLFRLGN